MMNYFAYGSNLSQEQMKKRCPDSKLIGRGVLNGYMLDFTYEGYADIIKSDEDEVWGLLYLVSENDTKKLDKYEGIPDDYKQIEVEVLDDDGIIVKAFAYDVVHKKPFVAPSAKYLDIIKKAARDFDFPQEYIEMLENIKFVSE